MVSQYEHKDESVKLLIDKTTHQVIGLMRIVRNGYAKVEMLKCEPMNMDEITDIIGSVRTVDASSKGPTGLTATPPVGGKVA